MLGTATAGKRAWPKLKKAATNLGQTASADDAWLALRGLRTLPVRLRQHEAGGLELARWLAGRPEVARVLHPAFEDCPGHGLFARDFSGACGLFAVVLDGGDEQAVAAMVDHMAHFKIGFSWGGFESLVLPADPSPHRTATRWEAPGPLLRLHVGLEDPEDLIADLEAGLARFAKAC